MSPPDATAAELAPAPTVTRLLRDATNRAILAALVDEPGQLDLPALQSRATPDAPGRFLRDRLRLLADQGIVERAPAPAARRGAAASALWTLTPAGRDLQRIHAVVTRIVVRAGAARLAQSATLRERAVETALDALADPAVLRILDRLAASPTPLDPSDLEEQCRPVTRRTLYRRLRVLQDEGVVTRLVTHEVPRRTHYALQDRWRPVAGALLLAAWWESRHGLDRSAAFRLSPLLHLVAPIARPAKEAAGVVRWVVGDQDAPTDVLATTVAGSQLTIGEQAASGSGAVVELRGSAGAWPAALVTDDRSALQIEGDGALGAAAISALRAALLSYVR